MPRTIAVFCGAAPGNDPAFASAARTLGEAIAHAPIARSSMEGEASA